MKRMISANNLLLVGIVVVGAAVLGMARHRDSSSARCR